MYNMQVSEITCKSNFKSQGFEIKDICHRSLDFDCLFLQGHLPVQVIRRFLAHDGSKIQASLEDFRPINEMFTSNIFYLLSHSLISFSISVVCGTLIL